MQTEFKKVCVIGLGYIGLPTATIIASKGLEVLGVDISSEVIRAVNEGRIHIVEPHLVELVQKAVSSGFLRASSTPEKADVFIIAVPTPFKKDHEPDLSFIEQAAASIAPFVEPHNLILLESTSPVGTTEKLLSLLPPIPLEIAYCPERVLPGHILKEIVLNDRVIGGLTPRAAEKAKRFYQIFVQGECLLTNARTAEMTKLTENAFRDVNIAFANELSLVCDKIGVNVWELIQFANRHPRVHILQPGPGVGGHCIAVDPWFLAHSAPKETPLIQTARFVNDQKPHHIVFKVREEAQKYTNPSVACLGLSFKPDIDDIRESPALKIVELLSSEGMEVMVVEPHLKELPKSLQKPNVKLLDIREALELCSFSVLLVHHQPFINMDRQFLLQKPMIDTRGVFQ